MKGGTYVLPHASQEAHSINIRRGKEREGEGRKAPSTGLVVVPSLACPSLVAPLTSHCPPCAPHTGAWPPPGWTGRCRTGAAGPGGPPPCTGLDGAGTAGQNSRSTCRQRVGMRGMVEAPRPGPSQLPLGRGQTRGCLGEKGEPSLAQERGPLKFQAVEGSRRVWEQALGMRVPE